MGLIRRVFTDNVDNLSSKRGVPFKRVRDSGVFNENTRRALPVPT